MDVVCFLRDGLKTITVAAPGAASMQFAEGTLNQVKAMTFEAQTQVMCDLANHADTPICRTYATWSPNIKLGFWDQLGKWMDCFARHRRSHSRWLQALSQRQRCVRDPQNS